MVSDPILSTLFNTLFSSIHEQNKDDCSFISFLSSVGLVKREDFPFITYYCPHCHALNRSNQLDEQVSGNGSPGSDSVRAKNTSDTTNTPRSVIDGVLASNLHTETISETQDTVEETESENVVSEEEEKVRTAETT